MRKGRREGGEGERVVHGGRGSLTERFEVGIDAGHLQGNTSR